MAIVSPLPEPDRGGFLSNLTRAVGDLWSEFKRTIKTPFGQETVTPIPDEDRNTKTILFNKPNESVQIQNQTAPTATPTRIPQPTPTLLPNVPQNPHMQVIEKYFPQEEVNNASNVSFKESSFTPNLVHNSETGQRFYVNSPQQLAEMLQANPNLDVGLFQINSKWQADNLARLGYTIFDMLDPEKAAHFASWLQNQQGWNPWYGADALGLTQRSQ